MTAPGRPNAPAAPASDPAAGVAAPRLLTPPGEAPGGTSALELAAAQLERIRAAWAMVKLAGDITSAGATATQRAALWELFDALVCMLCLGCMAALLSVLALALYALDAAIWPSVDVPEAEPTPSTKATPDTGKRGSGVVECAWCHCCTSVAP